LCIHLVTQNVKAIPMMPPPSLESDYCIALNFRHLQLCIPSIRATHHPVLPGLERFTVSFRLDEFLALDVALFDVDHIQEQRTKYTPANRYHEFNKSTLLNINDLHSEKEGEWHVVVVIRGSDDGGGNKWSYEC